MRKQYGAAGIEYDWTLEYVGKCPFELQEIVPFGVTDSTGKSVMFRGMAFVVLIASSTVYGEPTDYTVYVKQAADPSVDMD